MENNRAYLLRTEITKSHLNYRICQHCGVKTSTVTPSFYYVFNISLSCNINIPSFIGNLWWDLLLGNHLKTFAATKVVAVAWTGGWLQEVSNIVIWLGKIWYFRKLVTEERWSLTRGGHNWMFDCIYRIWGRRKASERRNSGEQKEDESRVWDEIRSSLSRDQLTVSKNGGHQCKYLLAAFKAQSRQSFVTRTTKTKSGWHLERYEKNELEKRLISD